MSRVAESSIAYQARPAVRIEQNPLPALSDQELLALVIGGAYASSDAGLLLEAAGGNLKLIYNSSLEELVRNYAGVGYATAKRLKAALELGRRLTLSPSRDQIGSPATAVRYFTRMGLALCEQEELWVAILDNKNRVANLDKVYRGNVNTVIIRPAEILRSAVRYNACSIIVAHNHPSGDPTPSPEDVKVTRSIRESGEMLGIDVLDHIIVSPSGDWVSLKERGLGFRD
jgi:DNA repair protein RadC